MAPPPKVTITYCAECGYEDQTLALARALMLEFRDAISGIELIPWEGGAFDVSVGGALVHSMKRDGGFADHDRVKAAVRATLKG